MIPRKICVILLTYISADAGHVFYTYIDFFFPTIYVHQKTAAKVVVEWQGVFGRMLFVLSPSD